jgi:threonine/homoserine/homoserine lactone efflux protein
MEDSGMLSYLSLGAVLGLTAGISPGPLLALVISETLKHNKREGIKIALTPLVTDLPIILFSLIILSVFSHSQIVLCIIAFLGSTFVAYLGYDCLNSRGLSADTGVSPAKSVRKGTLVNILNPHPYLFWITVGAPIVMKAWNHSVASVAVYFLAFYLFLVGSKITIALLVDKSKAFLNNGAYIWIMRILGLALFVFAILFFLDGIRIFKKLVY